MHNKIEIAILKTVLYSDIFNFPLTEEELWRFLLINEKISKQEFGIILKHLPSSVVKKDGFYCLGGRENLINQRKQKKIEAERKLRIAKSAAYYLSYIPTVSFLGISGSTALGNVTPEDDIDLFIITKKNTLFMTRLWVLAVLEIMQLRRARQEKNPADKVCVNLMLDASRLTWLPSRHDVYIAHEIAQIKPLFERDGMYNSFLLHNTWIKKFLPNSYPLPVVGHAWMRKYISLQLISRIFTLRPFEWFVQVIQRRYMKKYKTTETVTRSLLAFHPYDYRTQTLQLLQQKYADFGLLTKK